MFRVPGGRKVVGSSTVSVIFLLAIASRSRPGVNITYGARGLSREPPQHAEELQYNIAE
jgi:hypothetical protein